MSSEAAQGGGTHAFCASLLARGELDRAGASLAAIGFDVQLPAPGVLQVASGRSGAPRVLLSAGVHGDEVGPLELLADVLAQLHEEASRDHTALACDMMIAIGNPPALAAGKRFVSTDLNRLFGSRHDSMEASAEAQRAAVLMRAVDTFFRESGPQRWHFDLHSTIRASLYPSFAVVPQIGPEPEPALLAWLAHAGIDAAILTTLPSTTFSGWTARQHHACSATLELGRIALLGQTDLRSLAATGMALQRLLRDELPASGSPPRFRVVQELRKHSEAFRARFDANAPNFTRFAAGSLIAEDDAISYRAGSCDEYVVFPNPDVRVGLRAGLMVVREGLDLA
ncbi:MAG TPA: succinylglutamate desuccinylase [Noviherbaspirillum sp.]